MKFTLVQLVAALPFLGLGNAAAIEQRAVAVDQLIGYGAGTTGGGTGAGKTVTTCAALKTAAAAGGVVKINGLLSGCGIIKVAKNTSILGVGAKSGMTKGGLLVSSVSNVIIRNLKFYLSNEGDDLVAIQRSTKVWVDHCEFYNQGIVGDKDFHDGLLDVVLQSDFVTISWNKFHDHWKGTLIGNGPAETGDIGKLRVTLHHNSYININSRLPALRFGSLHIYNNCYQKIPSSGINAMLGGQVLVENNSFTDVARAIITNYDTTTTAQEGFATQRGNLFLGKSPISISRSNSYKAPYTYTLDTAASVCATIASKAGPGVVTF